ncbi:MAG: hypothetical protein IMZ61_16435 [Planctomycetes bacterium]|nr:hypothetical protein [Planctomycetota bacterium]
MTFEQWQAIAKSSETKLVGRNIIRDFYTFPNGIHVMEDYITPANPFRSSSSRIVVSYIVPMSTVIEGAEVSGDYYTEEGFGVPVFSDMEKAFNYSLSLKGNQYESPSAIQSPMDR